MRVIFTLFIFCACYCFCSAQGDDVQPPRLALKWSPWHLAYFYPSAQFAVEHRLFGKFYAQYDLGSILNDHATESENYQNKKGYRGLVEVRYYVPSPGKVPFYVAADYYYSRISFNRSQVVGYNCDSGNCDFFEYVTYKVKNTESGPGIKFGMLLFPGWNKNRSFFFDVNSGLAYRHIRYDFSQRPDGDGVHLFSNNSILFAPREDSHSQFRFVIGIRMGFRFF